MSIPKDPPLIHLRRQAGRVARQIALRQRLSARLAMLRLVTFLGGGGLSVIALFGASATLFWWLAGLTILLFAGFVYLHRRVERSLHRFTLYSQLISSQLARLTLDWSTLPTPRAAEPRFDHPFEADLDLVGERSLHRLLDVAVSAQGSAMLRSWLTASQPNLAAVLQRQALVRELLPLHLLRHRLIINGRMLLEEETGWEADRLLRWLAESMPVKRLGWWVAGLAALAALNLVLFFASYRWGLFPLWRYSLVLYAGLYMVHAREITGAFFEAAALRDDLERLLAVFRQLECFRFQRAPELRRLCAPLQDQTLQPSQLLRRVVRIVDATGIQGNPLVALALNLVAPWGLFFVWRLAGQKVILAELVPRWLACWSELEALSSLANAAYLHPEASFPVLRADEAPPVFAITGLGHPLLPAEHKVRNDFVFDQLGELALITGSNMAGKSTFLRAVGVNLALAAAGGVVDAVRLETPLFRLFTCVKVSDSVTDGISYFYAEVRRLKALLDALEADEPLPLFFCIDEIFRGTNNRERLLGSRAYILALVQKRGVGLIATHDLDLVKLAEESPQIHNFHFRDRVIDGRLEFDYHIRPGPSPTTNALAIMRSAGLPAPASTDRAAAG